MCVFSSSSLLYWKNHIGIMSGCVASSLELQRRPSAKLYSFVYYLSLNLGENCTLIQPIQYHAIERICFKVMKVVIE